MSTDCSVVQSVEVHAVGVSCVDHCKVYYFRGRIDACIGGQKKLLFPALGDLLGLGSP